MAGRVAIIGTGYEGLRPVVSDLSTREMMFEAASKAYADAGVDPREDVGSFICCTEDLWEGWSIADEMVPDQIGGANRPVCTVPADGVIGLGHAVMQITAGLAEVVALEAHSKVADVLDKEAVERLALEPTYTRPLGLNSDVLAGLEMSAFLAKSGYSTVDTAEVVAASKLRAMKNPRASYGGVIKAEDVVNSGPIALPLRELDKASFAEGSIVLVIASEEWAKKNKREYVLVEGVSWAAATPWLEGGGFERAEYAELAFRRVCKQAKLKPDLTSFDIVELDDTYSYKLLQHLYTLTGRKTSLRRVLGEDSPTVNPSGGALGIGNLIEASGLERILECVLQLKRNAGVMQVNGAERALVLSWRGQPTATGGVAILSGRNR
ncbi:MAG: thiolase domain-containing protein [Thaumarchaeota archaeon]|nr:thiolase domain-containing protein [Nitrososphaerota archaeon]